jgi:hypothetical protein
MQERLRRQDDVISSCRLLKELAEIINQMLAVGKWRKRLMLPQNSHCHGKAMTM